MPVRSRGQVDGYFLDAEAVQIQDVQALEEEPVSNGMNKTEEIGRDLIQAVHTEGARRVERHSQQGRGQEVAGAGERPAEKVPVPKATFLQITRSDHHIIAGCVA